MSLRVIGAGFGRTGTMSLKHALNQLGYGPCYHMDEVIMQPQRVATWGRATRGERLDWNSVFEEYRSTVDWPGCTFWTELLHCYPDAKVVLTVRDANAWYDSVMKTIVQASRGLLRAENPMMRRSGEWLHELIWDGTFDGQIENRAHAIAVFNAHNERVKRIAPADQLLVFESTQGWGPLCAFLGASVPDTPYPRVNTSEDYVAAIKNAGLLQ